MVVGRTRRTQRGSRLLHWVAVAVTVAVAFNLRTAITSVSPLMDRLAAALHLSGTASSVLAATPVLCFGAIAPVALLLERRVGLGKALLGAMALLLFGLAVRTSGSFGILLGGTVVACGGIALANILGPAYIKQVGGASVGVLMGLYVATMGIAAAGASLASPYLATLTGGWRVPLLIWALPALIACCVAGLALRYGMAAESAGRAEVGVVAQRGPRLTPQAPYTVYGSACRVLSEVRARRWSWLIVMTATQSVVYYSVLAWLPTVFEDSGASPARAGGMLSVFAVVGVPISLALPPLVTPARLRWPWVVGVTALSACGLAGLSFAPLSAPLVWVVGLGLGQGGIFALVLSFILLSSRTAQETVRLSLMAQMAGFLLAFIGPLLLGEIHTWVGDWRLPLGLLLLVLLPQLLGGLRTAAGPHNPIALAAANQDPGFAL